MAEFQRGRQKNADGANDFSDSSTNELTADLFKRIRLCYAEKAIDTNICQVVREKGTS